MLRPIRSIPDRCPDCGSENLGGQLIQFNLGNTLLCNSCGIIMVVQDADDEEAEAEYEVSASFLCCPHCLTVDEIDIAGGEEWCAACGLDPNREDYPPEELAKLWKTSSGIQAAMERGIPKASTRLYRFLTSSCGPHCPFEEECPQSTGNYAKCFREEVLESEDPDLLDVEEVNVGRSHHVGKGHRRKERKARKAEKERIRKEKERAVLVCAGSGWYEKRYRNETEDPQELDNTGSGSGT